MYRFRYKICLFLSPGNSSSSTSAGVETSAPAPSSPDPNLDSMHMMLDPHLRPISPDLNDEESKRVFEEHKKLAQEYLKVGFFDWVYLYPELAFRRRLRP